jgi:methylated-DNA-[protein]-cysteine S-methyltransferase
MPLDADRSPTAPDALDAPAVTALDTPLGRIALHWRGSRHACVLERVILAAEAVDAPTPPAWLAAPFAAYFDDPRRRIELPTRLRGTAFQRRVWRRIAAVPAGATCTYGELAQDVGSAARAIGGACRANPCPLVVPCHRVVARAGLGGFAGDVDGRLLAMKRRLLAHERHVFEPRP